jgi:predicted permease
MGTLLQDLRFALRMLRKSPAFALATVLTLAVPIAANTVALGAFDALILRPLNVPHPESLYEVGRVNQENESYPSYLDLRDRNRSFDGLSAVIFAQEGLDTGDGGSPVWGYKTSGNYFDVLGIQPYLGRFFNASGENDPNNAPYMVLTYAYWHTHFHDDRGVVGRSVRLNKHPVIVIGVAPPGFGGTVVGFSPSFFIPITMAGQDLLNARGNRAVDKLIGHLKPGITPSEAIADLNSIGSWLQKTYPQNQSEAKFRLSRPGFGDLFGGAIEAFLGGLVLLAALILLAACANLGSFFTARAADRSREIAMRLALGAPRLRVVRQLLTEALLISIIGGAAGLWGSAMLLEWLSGWEPFPEFPMNVPVTPDNHVYGIALLLAIASGFLFGAAPIRLVLCADPYGIVKSGSRSTPERRVTVRDVLLGVQIAICAVLVTSSIVAVRRMLRSLDSHLGIDPRNAMLVRIDPALAGYKGDGVPEMQQRMIDAVKAIPGVTSVGLVGEYPPLHVGWNNTDVFTERTTDLRPANAAADAIVYEVSTGYFRAAGTSLLSGRPFTMHDDQNSPRVAIVNREFVRKMFGSAAGPIGRYFKMKDGTRLQVVGVVEDGKYTANLAEDRKAAMFLPILQSPSNDAWIVVRSSRDPQQMAAAIREQLRNLDAALPVFMQTWNQEMSGALFAPRMAALSLGVLGLMGAVLSITGIFGMAAYSVSQRKRELAIRIALGAARNEILRTALGRAVKLLASGSAAGLILGFLASRVLGAIVYQATPRDPLVLAGVVLAMASLGLAATWIPAQRTLSLDPIILLREE